MATFTKQTKNTTELTNQTPSPSGGTFAEEGTFADEGTFGTPKTHYDKQAKNTTSLTNQTKL